VTRGHRLVADDVVVVEPEGQGIAGCASEMIGHHIEIRGLGILSVPDLFGSDAVRVRAPIDLVCRLDRPGEGREYERVGIVRDVERVAGVDLPAVTLPARPGGSMATVVEVAARDHRLRASGINAAARLDARLRGEMQP
jgi:HPr kinase/phosphorylase